MPKISVITPSIRPAGLSCVQASLQDQSFQDFEWLVELGLPIRGPDLNKAYNRLLARSKGELVVSYQDYISIAPRGLQSLWEAYLKYPKAFITCPMVKVKQDGSKIQDWRIHRKPFELIRADEWEADWASAPAEGLKAVGGWDEDYDQGWSWDNVVVAEKALRAGYEFRVDPSNVAYGVDHDELFKHPFRGQLENSELHAEKMRAMIDMKPTT